MSLSRRPRRGGGKWLFDTRWAGPYGIGRYAREVLARLSVDAERIVDPSIQPASKGDFLYLTYKQLRGRHTHYYSPGFNAGAARRVKQILTVHDLIHLKIPEESSPLKRVYYERILRPAIEGAGLVFTVSQTSATDIARWTGLPADSIVVAPGGCSDVFRGGLVAASKSGLGRPYVLYVGNAKPHKRFDQVASAAETLTEFDFVCVGIQRELAMKTISRAAVPRFSFLNGIPDLDLANLYAGAACLLLPSEHEGWGLPAVEAMAAGIPVVYSCEAVAEVMGDIGVRLPSDSPAEQFAVAIRGACQDWGPAERRAAQERSALFTWDKTAAIIQDQLERVGPDDGA